MALVHAEHQAVDDLDHDGNVCQEFFVVASQVLSQLNLDKLVEFLGSLDAI